jgi:hypothetical protein
MLRGHAFGHRATKTAVHKSQIGRAARPAEVHWPSLSRRLARPVTAQAAPRLVPAGGGRRIGVLNQPDPWGGFQRARGLSTCWARRKCGDDRLLNGGAGDGSPDGGAGGAVAGGQRVEVYHQLLRALAAEAILRGEQRGLGRGKVQSGGGDRGRLGWCLPMGVDDVTGVGAMSM